MLIILFWTSIAIILYTFIGFPILIAIFSRLFEKPIRYADINPSVTLLVPAYNEADVITAKIENSLSLEYPSDMLDIVIVADGSTDKTMELVEQFDDHGVRLFFEPPRLGKITAVSRIIPLLTSDIIIFSDANTMLETQSVTAIIRHFADSNIAAVAGEKRVKSGGEGLYWRYESFLKQCDSKVSSVMGAAGELFAIRRNLYTPPEADSIIEDFIMSMRLVSDGWRVTYEPNAITIENASSSLLADWQRRTRIAAGGFQSVARMPQLLNPKLGWVSWQYISHRVLRWTVTPFLLPLVFILNWIIVKQPLYLFFALTQTIFYVMGLIGYWQARRGKQNGLFYLFFFFCLTNLAAIMGFWKYITNSQPVTWKKVR